MGKLISVIVPVYNSERYLCRCIGSLLDQGLSEDELEIILVNDGSTDGSLLICQEFSAKHANVRWITQRNMGVGIARNVGMDEASGEYICFVDSDDYLFTGGLSKLRLYCDGENDLVRYWCKIVGGEEPENALVVLDDAVETFKATGRDWLKCFGLEEFCVNWLYRREFIRNKILFDNVIGEDFRFISKVLFTNPRIVSVPLCIYAYVVRAGSISTTRDAFHCRRWTCDLYETILSLKNDLDRIKGDDDALYESCIQSLRRKTTLLIDRALSADLKTGDFRVMARKLSAEGLLPEYDFIRKSNGRRASLAARVLVMVPNLYPLARVVYRTLSRHTSIS